MMISSESKHLKVSNLMCLMEKIPSLNLSKDLNLEQNKNNYF